MNDDTSIDGTAAPLGVTVARARLLIVVVCTLLIVAYAQTLLRYTDGVWVLPLDDTYIYLQYARNLAAGHLFQYNQGDPPSTGTTSLLYPLLLAAGALAGLDGGLAVWAFVLNGLFLIACCLLLFDILRPSFGAATALAATLLVTLTGPIVHGFLTGMDIGLLVLALLLAVRALQAELGAGTAGWWMPALLVALVLARPEGMVFTVVLCGLVAFGPWQLQRRRRLLLPIAVGLGTLAFNYALTGHIAPNSSHPKSPWHTIEPSALFLLQHAANFYAFVVKGLLSGTFTENLIGPLNRIDRFAFGPPAALLLYLVGAVSWCATEIGQRRPGVHLLLNGWLWFGILFIGITTGSGAHHFRYLTPFLPSFIVYVMAGVAIVGRGLAHVTGRAALGGTMTGLLSGVTLFSQLPSAANFLLLYGQAGYGFVDFREVASWAREHTEPDATIAALDVGMIAFFSHRRVLDLYGLTSNSMTDSTFFYSDVMGSKFELLERRVELRPDYFFGHRVRFEEHGDDGHLAFLRQQLVHRSVRDSQAYPMIGQDLSLYRLDWRGIGTANLLHDPTAVARTAGWQLLAALDTADLDSHRAHRYRAVAPAPGVFPANRVVIASYPDGPAVVDGAWGIAGREQFEVTLEQPTRLLLVTRTNLVRVPVLVAINSVAIGQLPVHSDGRTWRETVLEVPASATRVGINRITCDGSFLSAHHWVFAAAP